MITSDKFETTINSYRSRFISPVYSLDTSDPIDVCINIKYNIYSAANDGIKMLLENYLDPNKNVVIFEARAPLEFNMWYSASIQIKDLLFRQFRVNNSFFSSLYATVWEIFAKISVLEKVLWKDGSGFGFENFILQD